MSDPRLKAEIFKQKVPCGSCPFRKDGEHHTRVMMASYISYFVTEPGATFPCHKSVPKADPRTVWSEWQDGQVLCSGGLLFAAKLNRANSLIRYADRQGWYRQEDHQPEQLALVFDTVEEMLDAATDAPARR